MPTIARSVLPLLCIAFAYNSVSADSLEVTLRYQEPTKPGSALFHRLERQESWAATQTAIIVCDMWDAHHCVNAVRRVGELAPRINDYCETLRQQGVLVIHAPSSCMQAYTDHPARLRAQETPESTSLPNDIGSWCDQIPSEESAAYPIDQSAGGEDDDPEDHRLWASKLESLGRDTRQPWIQQTPVIRIDPKVDYISDDGKQIWSILTHHQIQNVILVGVHTNMCVLGRPFGLRRLASAGKNVVLARDLTDTMYDPRAWPYVSHFTGTDLTVSHIERYVCPTITSAQILGDQPFQFQEDRRLHLVMLIAEDEYLTEQTLPTFSATHLGEHFRVSVCFGSETERHFIPSAQEIESADALLVSIRRRALPERDLNLVRQFVSQGKPVIGIRTASHAFSLRGKPSPEGTAVWEEFDAEVLGGNYTGHHGNSLKTALQVEPSQIGHPILAATSIEGIQPGGSLYKAGPLHPGAQVLLWGEVEGQPREPTAWTYIRADGGRTFYTSLGHVDEFQQPAFQAFLAAGIHWACGLTPHTLEQISDQQARVAAGKGRQR